jgi:predicted  nucleic acid-binding Zn-ribbon protein
MDIEKIKKINEMSKTLQHHGIVGSSEEGSELANQLGDESLPKKEANSSGVDVSLLVERMARKLNQRIDELHDRLDKMEQPAPQIQSTKPEKREEKKEDKPQLRSDPDQFKDQDVSVENMFYYGNK